MSSTVGSPTYTGWKRRSSAGSFSMCLRYSSSVVAPIARSSPRASIGLSMLPASIAPSAAPAPTIVCSSSMNTTTWPWASAISFSTAFSRSSNSPRYLEPATIAPMSSDDQLAVAQALGDVAVDDPLGKALDDRGLADAGLADQDRVVLGPAAEDLDHAADLVVAPDHRVELALVAAASVRSRPKRSSAWNLSSGFWSVTLWLPRTSASALSSSSRDAPARAQRVAGLAGVRGDRQQQMLGGDVLVLELAHLGLGGAQDLDELAGAAGRLGPRPARSASAARRARAPSAWRTAAGSTPSLRSTGTTTPPSCSSSTASRCSGVVWGLRRSSASRCAACNRLLCLDRKSVWLHGFVVPRPGFQRNLSLGDLDYGRFGREIQGHFAGVGFLTAQ